jgi:hypothetical protein
VSSKKQPHHQKRGPKPRPVDPEKAYEVAKLGADQKELAESQDRKDTGKFAKMLKEQEELGSAIKLAREELKQEHETRAIPAATKALLAMLNDPSHPGHTAATLFVHKTMLGYREGVKHEVSGEVSHVHSLSPEDRAQRIAELRRELDSAVDVQLIEETKDDSQ